jgi:hypothetical protein
MKRFSLAGNCVSGRDRRCILWTLFCRYVEAKQRHLWFYNVRMWVSVGSQCVEGWSKVETVRKKIGKTWTPRVVHTASVLCDFGPSLLVTTSLTPQVTTLGFVHLALRVHWNKVPPFFLSIGFKDYHDTMSYTIMLKNESYREIVST